MLDERPVIPSSGAQHTFLVAAIPMNPNRITDQRTLGEWLKTQSHVVAVALAHRAAMRTAPDFWMVPEGDQQRTSARNLQIIRSLLLSGIAGSRSSPEITAAAAAAWKLSPAYASAAAATVGNPSAAASAVPFLGEALWREVRGDAARLDGQVYAAAVLSVPLWQETDPTSAGYWQEVISAWQSVGPHWQFWIDWYEAALDGRPLLGDWDRHWDLLTEIALIPDADWTAGPERVNARIAELAEKHRLRKEAEDLRAENARFRQMDVGATPEHRGHNNPPELIEAQAVREVESAALRANVAIEAIANELRLSKPEPEKLEQSASQLSDALGSVLNWLGSKGDRAVDKLIDWGVPAGAIWLLSNQEKIEALISGVKGLAKLFGVTD